MAKSQPSGVRLAFRTDATGIELDTLRSRVTSSGAPVRPDGVMELVVKGEFLGSAVTSGGNTTTIGMATGVPSQQIGPACTSSLTDLPAGVKDTEIWLPHNEVT
ncbi:hypothetical protein AAGW05_16290 [Arthrobacter sp. LAPM80]|uniref:hypothetical protein n=1 Tax=Arthrobacter sp. LAPM80 TaxID=3141788 RepID=UPI00398BA2B9